MENLQVSPKGNKEMAICGSHRGFAFLKTICLVITTPPLDRLVGSEYPEGQAKRTNDRGSQWKRCDHPPRKLTELGDHAQVKSSGAPSTEESNAPSEAVFVHNTAATSVMQRACQG